MRTVVVWCPDWPAIAAGRTAGVAQDTPIAVLSANRVVACNATARAAGVRRGLRKREAQARCPDLAVLAADEHRDARLFEPVTSAVEELAPGVEVVRPGVVAVPARGLARYAGGEQTAAELLVDHTAAQAGVESQVGVADGLFAALLAARRATVVPPGGDAGFLAPLDVRELVHYHSGRADLADLLRRLGLRTLGDFAALRERDVASRFDSDAVLAHRLAKGLSERLLSARKPSQELAVTESFDPPVDRVDVAAFAARSLAARLAEVLAGHGACCSRLGIHTVTESGEELYRVWRLIEPLSTVDLIADRVRWQLESWLTGGDRRPCSGLVGLRLEPETLVSGRSLQLGLWTGEERAEVNAERAGRALIRVQALLGPGAVCTATLTGGRGPAERVKLVPWGDSLPHARSPTEATGFPWPGRLPAPSPSMIPVVPERAMVRDAAGAEVGVTGRHVLTAEPATVSVNGTADHAVLAWAGPWPVDERWWECGDARRVARIQVLLAGSGDPGGEAALLARSGGIWLVEGRYV